MMAGIRSTVRYAGIVGQRRVVTLCLLATVAVTVSIGLSRAAFPHDVGQYDGSIWAPADLIAHGHTPYSKSTALSPPYVVAPYGPLYYGLIAVGLRLFGDQFWVGRGISLICVGLCALLVWLVLSRIATNQKREVALVGAGLFVAQFPVQAFVGAQRPDFVALSLALSGLALAFSSPTSSGKQPWTRAALSGCCLALAILVRQTLFLPLLVALLWFVLRRDRTRFIAALAGASATLAAVGAVLLATSHGGGLVWQTVRLQTDVPFSWHLAREHMSSFARSPATVFTVVMLAAGVIWNRRAGQSRSVPEDGPKEARLLRRLLAVYLALAIAVATVASAKVGSNVNYWSEVSLVLCLLGPLVWSRFPRSVAALAPIRASAQTVFVSLAILTFGASLVTGAREAHGQVLQWRALPYVDEVVAKMRAMTNAADPVISDYPDIAVSAGRRYYFNDVSTYQSSRLVASIMDRVIAQGRVKAIAGLASSPPPGYVTVCLSRPTPSGVYAVRLFYRRADAYRAPAVGCATA